MDNCDKYKNKYIIGIILIISWFFLIVLKDLFINENNELIFFLYIFVTCILSYKWIRKYMLCLQDYNNKHKPPFNKDFSNKVMW